MAYQEISPSAGDSWQDTLIISVENGFEVFVWGESSYGNQHVSRCRLTSAVAEHRRSVRPSRRTQGSRNPLRALAAREDITQDYMGDGVNAASEERIQAQKSEPEPWFSLYLR